MKTNAQSPLYWALTEHEAWKLLAAATPKGLCYISTQASGLDELNAWAQKHCPGSQAVQDDEGMRPYLMQLKQFLQGERTHFTVALDLRGTPFQLAVWDELRLIPYGETRSYSDIAERIGKPASTRAVGTAIGANPVLIAVPCHRVIGKKGALTGYRDGLEMKTRLLELEGNMASSSR